MINKIKTLCVVTCPRKNTSHNIPTRDYQKHLHKAGASVCSLLDFSETKYKGRKTYIYVLADPTNEVIEKIIENVKQIPFKKVFDFWVEY